MANKDLSQDDLELVNNSTDIYDEMDANIKKKVKEPLTATKLIRLTQDFMSKNDYALTSNIVGRRVSVNEKFENAIFDIFDLDRKEVKETIMNSKYFRLMFGYELQITDALTVASPLIIAAIEYKLIKKQEMSDLCWLLAHFKPYSSREAFYFKYGVREQQMLYTVENSLSERYDLKKYGTIINTIQKRAASSYNNYITPLTANDKITDKRLYVAYTSGIAGSMKNFIDGIAAEYRKNEGKSLDFEASAKAVYDKDADSSDFDDADIESDTAVKSRVVNKVILRVVNDPIDRGLVRLAAQQGFESGSQNYYDMLYNAISEITDKMFNQLDPFFTSFISAFLFTDSPDGKHYGINEFKSPIFLRVGVDILAGKKSNIRNQNMIRCRAIFKQMLENHSLEYVDYRDSMRRKFEKALAAYWVYLIKTTKF